MGEFDLEKTANAKPASCNDGSTDMVDLDAARLAEMGYTQDLNRNFSILSLISIAFCMSNSCSVPVALCSSSTVYFG